MVTIKIPALWKPAVGGLDQIEVASGCLADALNEVAERHPAARSHIYAETGEVRGILNLFINLEHARYRGGLAAELQDGDIIQIIPIISGGSR